MSTKHKKNWDRLTEFVAEALKKTGVPGAVVGVLSEGEVRTAGFGVTNVDHPLDVTAETLFQIGSITKTYTGTAMMRLVDMGKLDLDATVRTYLPDFQVADETASATATIRHLLTHVGGWSGDLFYDPGPGDDALPKYVAKMAGLEQLAPVGTVWSYNNAGFSLAGCVIEAVTGQGFDAAIRELVFEPLGLEHSFFVPGDVMTHRFAVGHNVGSEGAVVAHPWTLPRTAWPPGGITCSVHDLLRYASFHMGDGKAEDGTQILSQESLALMQTPQVTIWKTAKWGLSWMIDDIDGTHVIGHGGGTPGGQSSFLNLVARHKFAIAIFTNAGEQGRVVVREVNRRALKDYVELELPQPQPIKASEEELAAFVGVYSSPMSELELGMLGGKLAGQMTFKPDFPIPSPPPFSVGMCEKDRLLILNGPFKDGVGDVIRNKHGSFGLLRIVGGIYKRQS